MGVNTDIILHSNIVFEKFDFDEWPSSHVNPKKVIAPYNGSIYNLRQYYKEIFSEVAKDDLSTDELQKVKSYKIQYRVNVLPEFILDDLERNNDLNMINELSKTDTLKQFDA